MFHSGVFYGWYLSHPLVTSWWQMEKRISKEQWLESATLKLQRCTGPGWTQASRPQQLLARVTEQQHQGKSHRFVLSFSRKHLLHLDGTWLNPGFQKTATGSCFSIPVPFLSLIAFLQHIPPVLCTVTLVLGRSKRCTQSNTPLHQSGCAH